jgi:hypothetical protein
MQPALLFIKNKKKNVKVNAYRLLGRGITMSNVTTAALAVLIKAEFILKCCVCC